MIHMINFSNSRSKEVIIAGLVAILGIGGFIYEKQDTSTTPSLVLKKETVTIEYGQVISTKFDDYVKVDGLNQDDINDLKQNTKITSDIKNEREDITDESGNTTKNDRGFPAVGTYKITIQYKDETSYVKVKVKDTTAPVLTVPDTTEVLQGMDLAGFDFKSLVSAIDLAQMKDFSFDYSAVDTSKPGEYQAKASIEDVNKNKTEKEFKVTVVALPTDENVEAKVEIQTDSTTGKKKSVVVKTKKESITNNTNNNNDSNRTSSRSNASSSTTTNSNNSRPANNGGNTQSTTNNTSNSQNQQVEKVKHWAECDTCGWYRDNFSSSSDASHALNEHLESNNHDHGNSGDSPYWE